MNRYAYLLAPAIAIAPMSASAGDLPIPAVDFEGRWVVSSSDGDGMNARVRFSADSQRMRMDMEQQGVSMTTIQDMGTREVYVWSDQMPGMAMRIDTDGVDMAPEATGESQTIGGETCTVWTTPEARVCIGEDNIPLETTGGGYTATFEDVVRTAQDPSLFEVPANLQVMEMPQGMPGGEMPRGMPF